MLERKEPLNYGMLLPHTGQEYVLALFSVAGKAHYMQLLLRQRDPNLQLEKQKKPFLSWSRIKIQVTP